MAKAAFGALGVAAGLVLVSSGAQGQGSRPALPPGAGHDTVATMCVACHELNRITRSGGYDREGWSQAVDRMTAVGARLTPIQKTEVVAYLAQNFPEQPKPEGRVIPGPVKVAFKEWTVPTPGSRPHDPLATRDGAIWYTGQLSNKLGRLDPKTGQIKEYPLKSPQTAPHGLVEDKHGNIWFTGNHISIVGKLDPKTGNVTEYKMPDPKAKDPHSLAFDQKGILWFTLQQSNMMGRLDPATGEIKLMTSLTPRSRPYGIMVNSKGIPFVVLFGTNKVARIDPQTLAIREYTLPDPKSRPRRMAFTRDDILWYSDFARGYLGRLDTTTGEVKEWPSPSGPKSQPYGIVAAKDAIWYSESGVKPNTVVRFDPKTQKFQTWAIPSGGYIVRKMDVTPDGNPVLATSTVNGVALVEVGK